MTLRSGLRVRVYAHARIVLFALLCTVGTAAAAADDSLSDERLEASYNTGPTFIHYPALDAYLAQVVRRLQGANPDAAALPLRLHAIENELPYSFVLNNGASYVSTGLLARLEDEKQLAAMIALSLAPVVRHDAQTNSAEGRKRVVRSYLPNLLIITATAGLGAIAIKKADDQAAAERTARLQSASDAVALHWLASAGYDPHAAPAALHRLFETLEAEKRFGTSEFSDLGGLAARADALDHLVTEVPAPSESAKPVDPTGNFPKISTYYALRRAGADVEGHPVSVVPILDRIEARQGETGPSAFLRAELIRRNSADQASVPAAIQAYERCVAHADAPPTAFRELAFLYRRANDTEHARKNFLTYLAHAPNADDAPIIRTYLENP